MRYNIHIETLNFINRKAMAIYMKKTLKLLLCLSASLTVATVAFAAKTELYALDGRTIFVDENQIEAYTAPGMGWYSEKPVTMYSADGRTLVVPADQVEAHKAVGWYLEGELKTSEKPETVPEETTPPAETEKETETAVKADTALVKYTDGTVVRVPLDHVAFYKALNWVVVEGESEVSKQTVTMYSADGVAKEVPYDEVGKYELEGWSRTKPESKTVTLYKNGEEKAVAEAEVESYKAQGWYSAYDESIYAYAAFGDAKNPGATALLEQKKYELAYNAVQDAIDKIEGTESEYVPMLHYLRSNVMDAWREAANSPLGFINYWYSNKDDKRIVVFEYRNVSNSRIKFFKINFDICDKDGNVIEKNEGSYYVDNLQMTPCEKKRVAWIIDSGSEAVSIKNLKVIEVKFSDGETWTASN